MAEGFVLNIPKEMLDRLQKADEKIEKLDKNSRRVGENIRLAFMESAKGVDKFIGSLNSAQKILDGFKDRKINVGLNLDAKAIDDLKKQLSTAGVNIPVGVTGTGSNAGGSNLSNLIAKIDTINQILNQILAQTTAISSKMDSRGGSTGGVRQTPYTQKQLESLNKKARTALYREELNALQRLTYAEKEKARVERENDKKNQIAHRQRMVELQQQEREIMRLAKAYRSMPSSLTTQGVNNLLAESKYASTVNQRIQAIKNLKNALKDISKEDANYKKNVANINKEIRRQEQELAKLGHRMNDVSKRSQNLFNISQQLGRALSLMFSVSQIGQYISKMVNVRKEMELQQRSLQVLLQSKDKANELWNQTLDLAVKSPFRVKELVTYTKQLAAYRIESDKLFETNKMLADVSAGLGVDMQRLILAFGQVKSASFLRGCLGKGTLIRLYNDDIKEVQDIVVGDVIMGDDNTPRNVKEIIYGKEQMYIVRQGVYGDDYRVNENHILTLKDKFTDVIVDIYVKDYLKDKERYNGVKIGKNNNIIDYPIELIKDNIDEYFGFVIDGNKRFLLGDGTITHNTELRQFTEAGIPMLEELSKYFEELYGRSVSVAEVFDMISKRMVTFTDVENVFQRMTSAGGVFFNMQEELSQTTAGMISNLQDSIDLMFNEIGKKNQGIINTAIKWARGLVDNWETVGMVMKGTLVTLAGYKIATKEWGVAVANVSAQFSKIFTWTNVASVGITAIVALIAKFLIDLHKYNKAIENIVKSHEKLEASVNKLSIDFHRLGVSGVSDVEEYKDKLSELVGIAQQQYNIEVDFVVRNLKSIEDVKQKFNSLKEEIISLNNFSMAFDIQFERQTRRGRGKGAGIDTDIENLSNVQKSLVPYFEDMYKILTPMIEKYDELNEVQKQFVDAFAPKKETQTSGEYFEQRLKGLEILRSEYSKFYKEFNKDWSKEVSDFKAVEKIKEIYGIDYNEISKLLGSYRVALGNLKDEQDVLFKTIGDNLSARLAYALKDNPNINKTEFAENFILNAINAEATAKEWSEEVRYEFYKAANEAFSNYEGFNIIPTLKTPDPIKLKQWQQKFNEEVEKAAKSISGKMKTEEYDYDLFSVFDINEDEQGLATTETKKLAELNQALDEAVKRREEILGKQKNKSPLFRQDELDDINLYIEQLTNLRDLLGGDDDKSKKGKNDAEERIKEQIRLIKELYQEYQKLSKEYGSSKAKGIVTNSFETLLKEVGLDITDIDFTNLQGVINSLTKLRGQAATAGKEASQELEKAIGETSVELGLILKVKEREETAKEIENMFSDYEMTIDLKKLDIPQNLAEDLFDVNWTDLGDIKQRLEQERSALEEENEAIQEQIANAYKNQVSQETIESLKLQAEGNKARLEDIDKFYQKWNDIERKSTEERLKTYYKYLLNEQHERVKIRLETLRKLQEVEATSEFTDAQKETITNKLREEERESLAKQTWKDFETSPMYMQLFDDIENMSKGALEQMIVTMGGLKTELQSMDLEASDLKEILSQINKVEEELERRNPFRNFAENANIALNRSRELARLEEQRVSQQKDYNQVKMEYNSNQDLLATSQDYLSTLEVGSEEYDTQLSYVEILQRRVNELEKKLKDATDSVAETNKQINNINDSSKDFYEQLKNIGSITKSVVDGVFQITDAMSWLPEETQLSLERMKGLSDSAFTIAGGIGSIMSGDIIGGITSLISGVSGLVSLFMEWSSGAKEAAIQTEKQGRLLTDLQNKYDRLNKAIDEAWDVAQIKQYNAELQKNLQQQIIAQKAIIEAQKSVKGANDYGSEQWLAVKEAEEELQKLYDTQEELQKNIYSKLTGGIMDDVLSTTESFVDAWYDAFKETGDGLKGLEDNFNEMLLNLVKRQAAMKIAGRFIDEWDKALERYASDGDLSNSDIEYYANKVKNDLPALSSQLETFFSSFDNVLGDASGNLSGLQRGISSITAEQADILASYANSCRFLLASIDTNLSHLASRVMSQMSGENPMVEQLRIIANNTQMLYNLFSGMTTLHPSGGRGLRVVI